MDTTLNLAVDCRVCRADFHLFALAASSELHAGGRDALTGSALSTDWQVAKPMVDSNKINPSNLIKNLDILK